MKTKENRLVVGSMVWSDTIPDWLLKEVEAERMIYGLAGIIGKGPEAEGEVGDAEVCVYLYTASLAAPMDSEMTKIYLYLTTKFMQKRKTTVPKDIRVEELTRYEQSELSRLKRQLYSKRGGEINHPLFSMMKQLKKEATKK